MPEPVSPPAPASKTMGGLDARCHKAMKKAMAKDFVGPCLVGPMTDFSDAELQACEHRVSVFEGSIYLTECPLWQHEKAAAKLVNAIAEQLTLSTSGKTVFESGGAPTDYRFRNRFECIDKKKLAKIPDGSVGALIQPTRSRNRRSPIVVEVAFRNKPFKLLVKEGANWVGPTTDVAYVVLVDIRENRLRTDIDALRIIVMKRVDSLASELSTSYSGGCIRFPWARMSSARFPPRRWAQLREVEVVFDRIITRANMASLNLSCPFSAAALNDWYGTSDQFPEDLAVNLEGFVSAYFKEIDASVAVNGYRI